MPRNPNEHDDRLVNGLSVDRSRRIDEILRRGRTMDRREELAQGRVGQIDDRILEISENISGRADADVYAAIARETQRKDKYIGQKDMYESMRVSRTNERITSEVYAQMGAGGMSSYVNAMSRNSAVNGMAIDQARTVSQSDLESRRAHYMGAAVGQFNEASQYTNVMTQHGEVDDTRLGALNTARGRQSEYLNEVAMADAALRKKRQLGLDTESRYGQALRMGGRVDRDLMSHGISQDIAGGKAPNASEARGQELGLLQKFSEQMRAINESADKTGPAFEALLGNLEKTSDELDRNRELQKQLREGGGGGGGASKMAAWAMFGGGALKMGAGLLGEIGLGQSNRQTQNRIAAAGEVNQMWDMRGSAIGGDMSALDMLTGGALDTANAEGKFNRRMMQGTQALSLGGDVLTAGAYGAAAVAGVATPGGRALSALSGGGGMSSAAGMMNSLSSAAVTGSDLARGVSANAEELAERQRQYALYGGRNYVTNSMRQVARNYVGGARDAALSVGGTGGAAFFEQYAGSGGTEALGQMANARISPEQFASLAAQGGSEQGSAFSGSSIFASRSMERAGYGSASVNMSRMGALAAGGAQNPTSSLQVVLEAAFSKSLDSSKALTMMVQNTSVMAQQSTGYGKGLDVSSTGASIIAGLINPNVGNQESAISRATTAAGRINEMSTGLSAGFADQVGVASISRAAGVGRTASANFRRLDLQTREALNKEAQRLGTLSGDERKKGESALADTLTDQLGLGEFVDPKTGMVDRQKLTAATQAGRQAVLQQPGFTALANPSMPGYKQYISGKLSSEDLKRPEYAALRRARGEAAVAGGLTGTEMDSAAGGNFSPTIGGQLKATGALNMGVGPGGSAQADADTLATASFKDMATQARLAAESMGGMVAAIKDWKEKTESLVGSLNDKSAEGFRNAAAIASKDFVNGALMFKTSVDKFAGSVGVSASREADNKTARRGGN